MDLDEIRQEWKKQMLRIEVLEAQNEKLRKKLSVNSNVSRRDKLKRTYMIFIAISIVMVPWVFIMFPEVGLSWALTGVFAGILTIEGIGNGYILWLIRKLDFATMSTRDALRGVIRLENNRRYMKRFFMMLTIPAVAYFFYEVMKDDVSMLVGGIVGGLIGGIVGYRQNREIKSIIKEMKQDLADLESDT